MPEIIIKYKSSKTLQALKDFAKYFDFVISYPAKTERKFFLNGVTIIPADSSVDISRLKEVFTGKEVNSKEFRNRAWQRWNS